MNAERIRLLEIPGVDLQPCGGTHVRRTGDIGVFKVLSEGAVAADQAPGPLRAWRRDGEAGGER